MNRTCLTPVENCCVSVSCFILSVSGVCCSFLHLSALVRRAIRYIIFTHPLPVFTALCSTRRCRSHHLKPGAEASAGWHASNSLSGKKGYWLWNRCQVMSKVAGITTFALGKLLDAYRRRSESNAYGRLYVMVVQQPRTNSKKNVPVPRFLWRNACTLVFQKIVAERPH